MSNNTEYFQEWYRSELLNSGNWIRSAKKICRIMNILKPHLVSEWEANAKNNNTFVDDVHRMYMMLNGFAIENIFKSIYILNTPEAHSDNFPSEIKTHSLRKLSEIAQVKLNEDELVLLDKLSDYVMWRGRYPAPVSKDGLKPVNINMHYTTPRISDHPHDIRNVQCLLKYIASKVGDPELFSLIDMSISSKSSHGWERCFLSDIATVFIPEREE